MWYKASLLISLIVGVTSQQGVCHEKCLANTAGIVPCDLLDHNCLCENRILDTVRKCVYTTCSTEEAKTTIDIIKAFCERFEKEPEKISSTDKPSLTREPQFPLPIPTSTSPSGEEETTASTTASTARGSLTSGTLKPSSTTSSPTSSNSSSSSPKEINFGSGFGGTATNMGVGAFVLLLVAFVV